MSIRLLLVDEHPLILRGMRDGLRGISDIEMVGEAGDGQTALQLAAELQPEVVLMGCCLPDIPGAEVTRRLREPGLPTRVLAFSAYPEAYYLHRMFQAGAAGYILKTEPLEEVVKAVRAVAQGQQRWTVEQMVRILRWQTEVREPWESLTKREREVLALVAAGQSNPQIAEALTISENTVETHIGNLLGKLALASRTEAAVWIWRHGLPRRRVFLAEIRQKKMADFRDDKLPPMW